MKCEGCGRKIEETFLGKIKGTYIKGKPYCNECQKKVQTSKSNEGSNSR